ncbi:TVP38/TMEM64 family protein [Virgibacillus phasianinus]|uniref:TVP38/TMEM64 family membrane protein n=1 Tax=Virgibacillus phasianinus TaxID=2017483 RepID=A0A220TYM1_9BACI|nr:TVP38/TMEM64 family protein [Virgibacillus phasianinus]ASK60840.1 TVP38/TMEM64 family protein [Virgibacillus phasianinus]
MQLSDFSIANIKLLLEQDKMDEFINQLLNNYESLGPLPGLLFPFLEAFLPFLPLVVFVIANSAAYGLLEGFLLSWAGASVGAVFVFLLIRKLGDKRIFKVIRRNRQVKKVTAWLERHGFGPLFLLLCFPFSPSAIINVVAGLSKISIQQFVLAVLLGKSVMIFTMAYVGASIASFAKNPTKSIVVAACIIAFWLIGKYAEKRIQKRTVEKEAREQREKKG